MIDGKSVLAVITARGGSKGLPGKNSRPLCGKPLVEWSIEAARRCAYFDEIVVSTDDLEIADISAKAGANVPFIRPIELATDSSTSVSVLQHAVNFFDKEEARKFDVIALIEPTSPLREDDDMSLMLEKLIARWHECDSIIAMGEVHAHPAVTKRLLGDAIAPFSGNDHEIRRRQDLDVAYFPYGGMYFVKSSAFSTEETLYTKRCTYHLVERYQTFEIDDIYDFICVEAVMKYRQRLHNIEADAKADK